MRKPLHNPPYPPTPTQNPLPIPTRPICESPLPQPLPLTFTRKFAVKPVFEGYNFLLEAMLSIRKLTEYSRAHIKANTTVRRLPSISPSTLYQPKSRFEKIRSSGLVYPKSTPSKIVFVSNSYGNGFRNERNLEVRESV